MLNCFPVLSSDSAVVTFGLSQVIVCVHHRQKPCMCRWSPSAADLYMPFPQKRCNFTDRINFHRQLAEDKERREASPPCRHVVCLSVLSFLLLDRALCCVAEHERDSTTPTSFYFPSRLHW